MCNQSQFENYYVPSRNNYWEINYYDMYYQSLDKFLKSLFNGTPPDLPPTVGAINNPIPNITRD